MKAKKGFAIWCGLLFVAQAALSQTTTRIWALNAGSATRYGDFAGDTNTGNWYTPQSVTNLSGVSDPAPSQVYQSGKWCGFSKTPFTYRARALKPLGHYTLRLHYNVSDSNHKFDVTVNGTKMWEGYHTFAEVGNRTKVALIAGCPFQASEEGECAVLFEVPYPGNTNSVIHGMEIVEDATNNPVRPSAMCWPVAVPGSSPAVYRVGVGLEWPDTQYGNLIQPSFTVFRATNETAAFHPIALVSNATGFVDTDTLPGMTNRYFIKLGIWPGTFEGAPETNDTALIVIPLSSDYYATPYRRIWAVSSGDTQPVGEFSADTRFSSSLVAGYRATTPAIPASVGWPAPAAVYQNGRYSKSNFYYLFPVATNRLYRARLHFSEAWSVATRRFNVSVNGNTVTNGYCIYEAAGGLNTATVLEADCWSGTNGQIQITLSKGSVDNPVICGVEVVEPSDRPGEFPVIAANAWEGVAELRAVQGNTSFSATVWRAEQPGGGYVSLGKKLFFRGAWGDTAETGIETNKSYRYVVQGDTETPDADNPGVTVERFVPNRYSICMGPIPQAHFVPTNGSILQGSASYYAVSYPFDRTTVAGPAPQAVYQQQLFGSTLTFFFTNLHAHALYRIRLHSAETANVPSRTFRVVANGVTNVTGYCIAETAGGIDRAASVDFETAASDAGTIELVLTGSSNVPLVGGIEVRATPVTAAPAGLSAEPGSGKVTLTWQVVTGADGYAIYRTEEGGTEQEIARVTTPFFTDLSGMIGTTYDYSVRAFNEWGEGPAATSSSCRFPPPKGTLIRVL